MVGIVPRSAKLMELAGLFSGKAQSLLGRGVGSLAFKAFKGTPAGPCWGNACPSRVLGLGSLAPGVLIHGVFVSREPVLYPAPHALESQKTQQSTISGIRSQSVSKGVATGSETDLSVILKSWADLRS